MKAASSITNEQIRELRRDGLIDANTLWDAIYNDHTAVGRQARQLCAAAFNTLHDASIVSVESCS